MPKTFIRVAICFVMLTILVAACSDRENEENRRKAQLFDAAQVAAKEGVARDARLKSCFDEALTKRFRAVDVGLERYGCEGKTAAQLTPSQLEACNFVLSDAERVQLLDED